MRLPCQCRCSHKDNILNVKMQMEAEPPDGSEGGSTWTHSELKSTNDKTQASSGT